MSACIIAKAFRNIMLSSRYAHNSSTLHIVVIIVNFLRLFGPPVILIIADTRARIRLAKVDGRLLVQGGVLPLAPVRVHERRELLVGVGALDGGVHVVRAALGGEGDGLEPVENGGAGLDEKTLDVAQLAAAVDGTAMAREGDRVRVAIGAGYQCAKRIRGGHPGASFLLGAKVG